MQPGQIHKRRDRPDHARRAFLACAVAAALAPPAFAHRAQSVLTTVIWNEDAGALEVIHRVHAHDAELALAQMAGDGATAESMTMTEAANRARLIAYVEGEFTLADDQGGIRLVAAGAELAGEAVLVRREARRRRAPRELIVRDRILRDVFEGQTNLVNVRLAKRTRTLLFSGRDDAKRADGLF